MGAVPAGTPVLVVLGDQVAVLGVLESAAGEPGEQGQRVTVVLTAGQCLCPDPDGDDIDPDCPRHYPSPPGVLVDRLLPAARAARGWALGGVGRQFATDLAGERAANVVYAVLLELLRPGRNGWSR